MAEIGDRRPARAWDAESRGVRWHLELDGSVLLPGRLATGRLTLHAVQAVEARALVMTLIGEEHWRHRVTHHDANGTTRTEVVTSRSEVRRVPENLAGPLRLAAAERWEATFDMPVPPLGPPSLDAGDAGLSWTLETKLDIDDGFDSAIDVPVVVAQPTALLRAGAVHVGQFALYESADVAADGVAGSIALDPMPLVAGESFGGSLTLQLGARVKLQEIRAELRVEVAATVHDGELEVITAWSGVLAPAGGYEGAIQLPIAGSLGPRALPTVELPHGKAQATFHVILARAWAMDTHLVRDVTIATT